MTEEQAKTKICPFTLSGAALPRGCIGSACMWWKWDEVRDKFFGGAGVIPPHYTYKTSTTEGHCGR